MASSGWKIARQQAVAVQPLDPLAVALVGLGPALDLPGELRRGGDDVEAGLQQGEEQDVAVDAGGLQGDGGDAAVPQPGDELAQPGGVGGELADGVGAVGGGLDADPVAWRRRRRCRRRGGVARAGRPARRPRRLGAWPRSGRGARRGCCERPWEPLQIREVAGRRQARRGESAEAPAVPTGSAAAGSSRRAVVTKRKGRKRSPSQSNQRAERGRSTHHRQYGHGRRACGQPTPAQPKFPARRRGGSPQNEEPVRCTRTRPCAECPCPFGRGQLSWVFGGPSPAPWCRSSQPPSLESA